MKSDFALELFLKFYLSFKLKNKLIYIVLAFVFFQITIDLSAQSKNSINVLLKKIKNISSKSNYLVDSNYYNVMSALANEYEMINPDSSMYFANLLLNESEKLFAKNSKLSIYNQMRAYYLIANVNQTLGQNKEAIKYYFQAWKIAQSINHIEFNLQITKAINYSYEYLGDFENALKYCQYNMKYAEISKDKKYLAEAYSNLGICFDNIADYQKALDFHYKALKYYKNTKNKSGILLTLNNIGVVFIKIKDYQDALKIFFEALNLKRIANYEAKQGIKNSYNLSSMAGVFGNIAIAYTEMKNTEMAILYNDSSLQAMRLDKNLAGIASVQNNIASLYIEAKKYGKAKILIDSSYLISTNIEDSYGQMTALISRIKLYSAQNNYQAAIEEGNKAYQIARSNNFVEDIPAISDLLFRAYEKVNDSKNALKFHKIFKSSSDSLFNMDKSKTMGALKAKYEYDKEKEHLIEQQNHKSQIAKDQIENQRRIIIGICVALVVFVLLLILILRANNKIKNVADLLQKSNQTLEKQNEEISNQNLEINRQNIELEKLNDLKDKFVSLISHDLRSPFAGFIGLTDVMVQYAEDCTKEELVKNISRINVSSKNLFKLLENLLELSIANRGLNNLDAKIELIDKIIEENIEWQAFNAEKKNISIVKDFASNIEVCCDIKLINSVVRNLLSNAIKFTYKNGEIKIGITNQDNDMILVSVSDNGVGMNEIQRNNLFRLDKKVSSPGTEGEASTGLGLLICKEYVEKHKCKLWFESIEGQGTTFYFTLPKTNSELANELVSLN